MLKQGVAFLKSDQINHQNKKDFTQQLDLLCCLLTSVFCLQGIFFFSPFSPHNTHTVWVTHWYKWLYYPSFSATPATHSLLLLSWCDVIRCAETSGSISCLLASSRSAMMLWPGLPHRWLSATPWCPSFCWPSSPPCSITGTGSVMWFV